jgi:hypothetical protein
MSLLSLSPVSKTKPFFVQQTPMAERLQSIRNIGH